MKVDDLETKKMYEFPLNDYRCKHASIFLDHDLYVAGGMKSGKHLNLVERYDVCITNLVAIFFQ